MQHSPQTILLLIVLAQFGCTSVWFASNAAIIPMMQAFALDAHALPHLTSAVQLGFIMGTILFAFFTISDRYSPSVVFFISALCGSIFNLATIHPDNTFSTLLILRSLTGFTLAGVYPVGMKIASDHFSSGLGKSLGWLVGALVLGTSLPHLIGALDLSLDWRVIIITTSGLSLFGGLTLIWFVPDGPYRNVISQLNIRGAFVSFNNASFKKAAIGYFGHMWELYTFWLLVPIIYQFVLPSHTPNHLSLLSFATIGVGSIGCVLAGQLSLRYGTGKVAVLSLAISGLCCLASPFILYLDVGGWTIIFLLIWGLAVVADSPLFSTLVAQSATSEYRGSALTIVNCIGFSITVVSIQIFYYILPHLNLETSIALLSIGPIVGIISMTKKGSSSRRKVK